MRLCEAITLIEVSWHRQGHYLRKPRYLGRSQVVDLRWWVVVLSGATWCDMVAYPSENEEVLV